jgi:hypothetical protein
LPPPLLAGPLALAREQAEAPQRTRRQRAPLESLEPALE